ncbi:HNH endonuclease signature motif containing protein [Actinomycetospora lemnae]|uniref:DUF222 domain-containing protein n=1 Tax=Actinomycetospora lemnae TaxID=3019891 RepID=A0ABT5SLX0_9PSEU|nr:HNH endonuclease signature motif containing protein [Actinomycetospora sp. DW7H6]MDD7963840.1 DUF222 domain-containing protein [Actinomycetospora sp. DW7H6]
MARLERVDSVSVEQWGQAEATLAEQATWLAPRQLAKAADALLARLDPDGVAPSDGEDCRDELVWVRRRRDGSLAFKGRLHDPLDAEAFCEVIDGLSEPCGPDDRRELGRRRADGLKDLVQDARRPGGLATHPDTDTDTHTDTDTDTDGPDPDTGEAGEAGEAGPSGTAAEEDALIPAPRRPEQRPTPARPSGSTGVERAGRALLTITMDHRWLRAAVGHATLDSGQRVAAATVRRWACDAEVVPVVLGSRAEPLDVGRATRTVPDALRRALNLRDGGCAHPGCDRRPRRCHAHHIHHWGQGGDTCLANLVLLCRYHHRLIHHGQWQVTIVDGLPWFTPPPWIDPDQRPRPGGRPRVPL